MRLFKIMKCSHPHGWYRDLVGSDIIFKEISTNDGYIQFDIDKKSRKKLKKIMGYNPNLYCTYINEDDILDITLQVDRKQKIESLCLK